MDSNNSPQAVTVSGVNWTVVGTVLGTNGLPVPGLMIEGWDKDFSDDDVLGRGTTNEKGQFEIKFEKRHFSDRGLEKRPDLYFLIFKDGTLIAHTKDQVLKNVDESLAPIVLNAPVEGVAG